MKQGMSVLRKHYLKGYIVRQIVQRAMKIIPYVGKRHG